MTSENQEELGKLKSNQPNSFEEQENSKKNQDETSSKEGEIDEYIPTEVVEALQELPENDRRFAKSMLFAISRGSSGYTPASIAKQIRPEHIDKILDIQGRENEIGLQRNQIGEVTKRWGMRGILAFVAMVFVYAGWTGDKELAEKVMIAGISGLGGFGAGVVVGKQTQ